MCNWNSCLAVKEKPAIQPHSTAKFKRLSCYWQKRKSYFRSARVGDALHCLAFARGKPNVQTTITILLRSRTDVEGKMMNSKQRRCGTL